MIDDNLDEIYNMGIDLGQEGKIEDAISCFDEILNKLETSLENNDCECDSTDTELIADIWFNKGILYTRVNKLTEALRCYNIANKLDPMNSKILVNKGVILSKMEDFNGAIQCYNEALLIDPQDSNAWFNKGNLLKKQMKLKEALICYKNALLIDPRPEIWYSTSLILEKMGQYENALFCNDNALNLAPNNPKLWSSKASILTKIDKNIESIEAYDIALSIKIEPNTLYDKGMVLFKINRPDEALECFDIILELDPNNSKAISAKKIAKKLLNKI
ncbi:MAG: tetratricopeptide repeat protein [Candidatus Helarchaeota archaeon]